METVTEPGKQFDGQGLFLRVAKNGAKQWMQRITIRGKRCELGLGSSPAVSLAAARKLALDNRGKAVLGGASGPTGTRRNGSRIKQRWTAGQLDSHMFGAYLVIKLQLAKLKLDQ